MSISARTMSMPIDGAAYAYGLYGPAAAVRAVRDDPRSVSLILMNSAQTHCPNVT
ncbi:MAG TPA: hypothetical protein VMR06_01990 [Dokdonella sp.]|uniref:hypothetical protein n=1 Tax=Dokdonella sp. TaxID=2291710 RepID=UPI002B95B201|nr:hypothetical protein [Dokdonella sp.]HUD40746.1 hypothetical protein [Dokdonella sp.]